MPSKTELKKTMFKAAEEAAKILQRYFGKIDSVVNKGEVDLVTVADKKAEAAIIRVIQRAFPDHTILGEESGAVGPASPKAEKDSEGPAYCWVVDPLDGTMNFAHSNPYFSISIGLMRDKETIMGLVVDVTRDEWFFASRGAGAFLYTRRVGGDLRARRIHVSGVKKLSGALIITGYPHNRRDYAGRLLRVVEDLLMRSHGVLRLGSAAIDLCSVACGRAEAFYEPSLQPWDMAAGNLLIEEAGGKVTDYAGKRLKTPGHDVVAANAHIHAELLRAIRKTWGKEPWD